MSTTRATERRGLELRRTARWTTAPLERELEERVPRDGRPREQATLHELTPEVQVSDGEVSASGWVEVRWVAGDHGEP